MKKEKLRQKHGLNKAQFKSRYLSAMRRARSVLKEHGLKQAGVKEKDIIRKFAELQYGEQITIDPGDWLLSKYENGELSDINIIVGKRATKKRKTDYLAFLKSGYWRRVKILVRDRDGNKCTRCDSTVNLHVHHKTYEHHGEEHLHIEDLVCLCEDCHNSLHRHEWTL